MRRIEARASLATSFVVLTSAVLLAACDRKETDDEPDAAMDMPRTAFVHLFEWDWPSVARECEEFLGPAGYAAVQVSPPQEHAEGPEWYTRYQPVSYELVSRGGSREEFVDMVERCRAAGVDIYVDAVINHMTGVRSGTGVGGTDYSEYEYPGLYEFDDFHHCGRNDDDDIANFDDPWEVRHCELVNLADLKTSDASVRAKIAGFLNDLLAIGVRGFRIDAAKHMPVEDIAAIIAMLESDAYVFQEVIYHGSGPITGKDYAGNGAVTEFQYAGAVVGAFENSRVEGLRDLGAGETFVGSDDAVVFVDNHDTQRHHDGHAFSYKAGDRYLLANVFMLAWPYGYPKVMSSFDFDDRVAGAPARTPVAEGGHTCSEGWVCEHRHPTVASMVTFRNLTHGLPATNWQEHGDATVSFGRGDKGHVVLNLGEDPLTLTVTTSLPPGSYCNLIVVADPSACDGAPILVGEGGLAEVTVDGVSAVVLHVSAMTD